MREHSDGILLIYESIENLGRWTKWCIARGWGDQAAAYMVVAAHLYNRIVPWCD